MTASTQGLTGQGLAGIGLQPQPGGFSPGFPQPIGVEQYFGMAPPWIQQPFGTQQQFGTQQPYGIQVPYGIQQPFGVQQPYGTQPYSMQVPAQVQQLASQVHWPIQQMILPQVAAFAVQQIQQVLPRLITQLVAQQQLAWQSPYAFAS
jgi:hypothetical protein